MADVLSNGNKKGRLFEFAILYHPKATKDQFERGENPKSVLVKAPSTILAASEQEVSIVAARLVAEEYLDKLEDVEIVVRPF